jgi:signal transduction histidine kinase
MPRRVRDQLRRRPWIGVVLVVLGVAALAWGVLSEVGRASAERERTAYWELHAVRVQLQTQLVLAAVEAAETGQRGYLLTGERRFLEPYNSGAAVAGEHMDELRRLTGDNPDQQAQVLVVERLMHLRLEQLAEVLGMAETGRRGVAITLIRAGHGRGTMEQLREELNVVWRSEAALLAERREASQRAIADQRRAGYLVSGLACILILVVVGFAVSAVRAERDARASSIELDISRRVQSELEVRVAEALEAQRVSEEALRQSQKMDAIGQLAGGIAHDLNNMLAVVIGSLEMAQRRLATGKDDVERLVANAIDGGRRAATLTQRILAFSRRQPLEPKVLNLNRLVSDMSELLHRTLGEQVKLETVLASGLWTTHADANQLESAILNLAVNARDAMPTGGALTVETGNAYLDDVYAAQHDGMAAGQYVFVAVTDTGTGMAPDVAAKAFEPFFTTKEVGKGTGLGLSQAFGFAKQSGGHIKIYSEVGQGTSMKLYLPRWMGEERAPDAAERKGEAPGGSLDEIILVVEDDERVRLVSVEALRELGYSVQHASNGEQALLALERNPGVQLLFTDVVMPDMGGRELADEAKKRFPDLKVLYTTGYTKNAIVHNGVLDADVAFIAKPFSLGQLARKVRAVLDK